MGALDDLSDFSVVNRSLAAVDEAARAADVRFTPIARELVALFVVTPTFDSPRPVEGTIAWDEQGLQVSEAIMQGLPNLVRFVEEELSVNRRPFQRGTITGADIYHWLTEHAAAYGRWLPYPKDEDDE